MEESTGVTEVFAGWSSSLQMMCVVAKETDFWEPGTDLPEALLVGGLVVPLNPDWYLLSLGCLAFGTNEVGRALEYFCVRGVKLAVLEVAELRGVLVSVML